MTVEAPVRLSSEDGKSRSAFIVAGMHRSGTSALTRTLSLLGLQLPSGIMPPAADNPKGFWESSAVAQLNDEILGDFDATWDDILIFLARRKGMKMRPDFAGRIQEVIESEFAGSDNIVLKEPRIGLLLEPWMEALRQKQYTPRVVIPVRNPLEVAASLGARNGFSVGRSLLLWLAYFLLAEKDSRSERRVFLSYTGLLEDWRGAMARVEGGLETRFPKWTSAVELEIDTFLSPSDRHQVVAPHIIEIRKDVADWVKRAYAWAIAASTGETEPDTAVLDKLADEFEEALAAFAPLIAELSGSSKSMRHEVEELRNRVEAAEHNAASLQAQSATPVAELQRLLAEREHDLNTVRSNLDKASALARDLYHQFDSSQTASDETRGALEQRLVALEDNENKSAQSATSNAQTGFGHDLALRQGLLNAANRLAAARFESREIDLMSMLAEDEDREAALAKEMSAGAAREQLLAELVADGHEREQKIEALLAESISNEITLRLKAKDATRLEEMLESESSRARKLETYSETLKELLVQTQDLETRRIAANLATAAKASARKKANQLEAATARLKSSEPKRVARKRRNRLSKAIDKVLTRGRSIGQGLVIWRSGLWHRDLAYREGTAGIRRYARFGPHPDALPLTLFDQAFYLRQTDSLRGQRVSPLVHYLNWGDTEGRSPHPLISTPYYRQHNAAGLGATGLTCLEHFIAFGWREGRDPHPLFDVRYYLGQLDPMDDTPLNPVSHYLTVGWRSGLNPHPLFDNDWYLQTYPDVADAMTPPLLHYVLSGAGAGYNPHPLFDSAWYASQYLGGARAAENPLADFVRNGLKEALDPNPAFSTSYYLSQTPDVALSGTNPLVHYLETGAWTNASPNPRFDAIRALRAEVDHSGPRTPFERWLVSDLIAADSNDLPSIPAAHVPASPHSSPDQHDFSDSARLAAAGELILKARGHSVARLQQLVSEKARSRLASQIAPARRVNASAGISPTPARSYADWNNSAGSLANWPGLEHDLRAAFDESYYRSQADNLVRLGDDALEHYLSDGWLLGLDPNKTIDNDAMLSADPTLLLTCTPPLVSYVRASMAKKSARTA